MKKALLTLAISLFAFGLFAETDFLIQGTYMNATRTFEYNGTETELSVPSIGLNFISLSSKFGGVGFFSSGTFLIPTAYEMNNNDYIELYDSMKFSLDAIIGPGANIPLGFVELLLGGGLHFNGYALMSNDSSIDPDLSYTLGAGLSATAKFPLSSGFNLNLGATLGYDFIEIIHIPDILDEFKPGLTSMAINAGIGFKY